MDDVRLIDANRLLKVCKEAYHYEDSRGKLGYCIDAIKHAPTVDAVPMKRGKWETKGGVHCTNCGWRPTGRACDLFTNYCAGCGAKMFEERL